MKRRFKPISRILIVFILVVAISGIILTFFSINSISSLKEITQKKFIQSSVNLQQGLVMQFKIR